MLADRAYVERYSLCVECAAEAASQAVVDSLEDLISSRDFPGHAVGEFVSRYGDVRDEMIEFAASRAREYAEKQDHSACEKHASTKDDEE